MKALILDTEKRTANVKETSVPVPGKGEVLVQVKAIALNPIDPLYVAHPLASSGRTIGSDFAGIVSSLGTNVPSSHFKVGDRVSGFLQGACSVNERPGAFAEYLVVPWDLVWKVPEKTSLEEASGVSLVALTAAQGIWYRLGMQAPFGLGHETSKERQPECTKPQNQNVENFFIYGASTSVGLYAAQMVRISAQERGRKICLFGAASKARWDMLKAEPYAYDHLVDYRDPDWPAQIKMIAGGSGMHYAYDCISEKLSVKKTISTLMDNGKAAIVRSRQGGAWTAQNLLVEPIYGAVWEGLGVEVEYQGFTVKESPAAREFAAKFYEWLAGAVGSTLKPNPIRVMPGGLERVVEDGFRLLGSGSMEERQITTSGGHMKPVSAEKLVYVV
ncbi:GroES-like protein [Corynespora cassiicola Philippines]|uniref:GroES-like protein n=1 Tax=Corynespora cassiicola Philippines TaxID=1448308 RepID=A0A2T2N272_CORCC|nr:GroES-like protein [Corynespora cassiicola Philippines]